MRKQCVQWYCVYQQIGKKLLETLDAQEVKKNVWNKFLIKARKFQRFAESKACWNLSQRLSDLSFSLISNSVDFGNDAKFYFPCIYIKSRLAGRPQVTTIALSNTWQERPDSSLHKSWGKEGKVAVFSVGNKMKADRVSEWVSERMVVEGARMCVCGWT